MNSKLSRGIEVLNELKAFCDRKCSNLMTCVNVWYRYCDCEVRKWEAMRFPWRPSCVLQSAVSDDTSVCLHCRHWLVTGWVAAVHLCSSAVITILTRITQVIAHTKSDVSPHYSAVTISLPAKCYAIDSHWHSEICHYMIHLPRTHRFAYFYTHIFHSTNNYLNPTKHITTPSSSSYLKRY